MRNMPLRPILVRMEETKFPVPEEEAHKLDAVVHTLEQQPVLQTINDSVRSQPWPFVLGAFAIGLLCSVSCARR